MLPLNQALAHRQKCLCCPHRPLPILHFFLILKQTLLRLQKCPSCLRQLQIISWVLCVSNLPNIETNQIRSNFSGCYCRFRNSWSYLLFSSIDIFLVLKRRRRLRAHLHVSELQPRSPEARHRNLIPVPYPILSSSVSEIPSTKISRLMSFSTPLTTPQSPIHPSTLYTPPMAAAALPPSALEERTTEETASPAERQLIEEMRSLKEMMQRINTAITVQPQVGSFEHLHIGASGSGHRNGIYGSDVAVNIDRESLPSYQS